MALPNLFRYTSGAVEHVRGMISGLKVESGRKSANVELTQGLIMAESLTMALAPHVGRPEAQHIVKTLCDRAVRSGMHLREVALEEEPVLSMLSLEEVDRALDPGAYLGSTNVFIEHALASYREASALEIEYKIFGSDGACLAYTELLVMRVMRSISARRGRP